MRPRGVEVLSLENAFIDYERTEAQCVNSREFRPEEDFLSGVIDPDQEHDQRACRPVVFAEPGLGQVDAEEELPGGEENRRDYGTGSHVAPEQSNGRQE